MTRKIIIGVIGATTAAPEGVPELAEAIGHEIGKRSAILMTGGSPLAEDRTVKDGAMRGCNNAGGRMISILKKAGLASVTASSR
jgi:predicted Rossmann-fold nucleotide-binding protein